jgi:hypothetical protein
MPAAAPPSVPPDNPPGRPPQLVPGAPGVQLGARSGGWPLKFDVYEPCWQLVWDGLQVEGFGDAAGGGATVSGMTGGGPATFGGAQWSQEVPDAREAFQN